MLCGGCRTGFLPAEFEKRPFEPQNIEHGTLNFEVRIGLASSVRNSVFDIRDFPSGCDQAPRGADIKPLPEDTCFPKTKLKWLGQPG